MSNRVVQGLSRLPDQGESARFSHALSDRQLADGLLGRPATQF